MYLSIGLVGKTLVFKLRGPEFEPRCGQLDHCDSVQNRLSTTTLLLIQASGLTLCLVEHLFLNVGVLSSSLIVVIQHFLTLLI